MGAIDSVPRPSLVANLHDECSMAISNMTDPDALKLLARVLGEQAKAAKAKAKEVERNAA